MIALDGDALGAIVRLMGDDVPAGFEELATLNYGPGSAWAETEPYDGPCPHDACWGGAVRLLPARRGVRAVPLDLRAAGP